MIELDNVSLYFPGGKKIINDVSWNIGERESWVLFGKNGSGKTKLLEMISGYISPSNGSVRRRFSEEVYDLRDFRKRIGHVGSKVRDMFLPGERIIDVVTSGYYGSIGLYEDPEKFMMEKSMTLIESALPPHRENDPFSNLSDGEKQRVMIARSMVNEPSVLILDEPCEGLDLAAREDVLSLIDGIAAAGRTSVIYVTHHVEEITEAFRNIFIIDEGKCRFKGDIEDGLSESLLSDIYKRSIRIMKLSGRFHAMVER
ncbi:MAG: ATP-binding cassette domain-containing protein [Spirochaetes bacterium]|jgi:iron complex transport system ATP-binding protein|nr:ATP-binding cassette domain-containing protein [Spirochaetota bacterium]